MKYATGICYNCSASVGLHHYETMQCPKNGMEASIGKKQEWVNTVFEDSGIKKLHDAAAELLEALQDIIEQAEMENIILPVDLSDSINIFGKQAIKKATE